MNLKGTERLLHILRAYGVSHYKTAEVEIRIDAPPSSTPVSAVGSPSSIGEGKPETKGPATAAAAPPVDMPIPHHVNEVRKLLKLSDEELVDRLFPDPTQEKAE